MADAQAGGRERAAVALSGGVDSFCAALERRAELDIELAVFTDLGIEREREAAERSAQALGVPLAVVRVEGVMRAPAPSVVTGVPFKWALSVLAAANVAAASGVNRLVCGSTGTGNNAAYMKAVRDALLTSPHVQPGVVLEVVALTAEREAGLLAAEGVTPDTYWFSTCNADNECGRCAGCMKKQRLLELLRG